MTYLPSNILKKTRHKNRSHATDQGCFELTCSNLEALVTKDSNYTDQKNSTFPFVVIFERKLTSVVAFSKTYDFAASDSTFEKRQMVYLV